MKKNLTFFSFMFFFVGTLSVLPSFLFGQPTTDPLEGFDEFVEKTLKDWNVPGASIAIVQNGKVVLAKGYGWRDVENKKPVTEETIFGIGSCSKAFTATTVMQLVGDALIDLDEPIRTYMPDFQLSDETATNMMTARDLLCHRSGLPRHDLAWYGNPATREELFNSLRHLEFSAPFRSTWQYQNLMFMTAGYLVERVSNKTWEEFTQERIFNPLGMTASNFSVEVSQKTSNFSLPYTEEDGAKLKKMEFRNLDAIGPAGSINSNAVDMAKWVAMLLGNGSVGTTTVIDPPFLKETFSPQMVIPGEMSRDEIFYSSYGLGWMITSYRGHLRVEHGGNIDGFTASVCLMPRDSFGVVVLANMNGTQFNGAIRNNVLDRFLGLEPIDWNTDLLKMRNEVLEAMKKTEKEEDLNQKKGTKPSHELKDYVGKYKHPAYGTITVSLEKDQLSAQLNSLESGKLEHYHYDFFQTESAEGGQTRVAFKTGLNGEIATIEVALEPTLETPIVFERVPEMKNLSTKDLQTYEGEYEIMGQVITVATKDETLLLTVPGQPTYTLEPRGDHRFDLKGLKGYSVLFSVQKNEATDVSFIQPNGTFKATRKK